MLTVQVSPVGGGIITSPDFSTTAAVTDFEKYDCSSVYTLTAVPLEDYQFVRWSGGLKSTTNPLYVSMSVGPKDMVAHFVKPAEKKKIQEAKSIIDGDKDVIVIDVRGSTAYDNGHVLCAKNYPWNSTSLGNINSLDPLKTSEDYQILVYDQSSIRSQDAANFLIGEGFLSVHYLSGDLNDLEEAGFETFKMGNYPGGDSNICTSILPWAEAGPDQSSVQENNIVRLNSSGTASGVTYSWVQIEGTHDVQLSDSADSHPTFTSPNLNGSDDTLIFLLTVSAGGKSDSDIVSITVNWVNDPPTANAGANQAKTEGDTVALDGSGSSDSDGTIAGYLWTRTDTSGVTVTLSNNTAMKPTFEAPAVDAVKQLTFNLEVTDNNGEKDSDSVTIVVSDSDTSGTENIPPIADSGPDQTVDEGDTVTLNGSGSLDPDGTIAGYFWTRTDTGAVTVTLSNNTTMKSTFKAPAVDEVKQFTFKLEVTDDDGAKHSDFLTITVNDSDGSGTENIPPVADSGPDQTVKEGDTVILDGSASVDSDDGIKSYLWSQVGGVAVSLSDTTSVKPAFDAPIVSNDSILIFQLTVEDNNGETVTDQVEIKVNNRSSSGSSSGCFISSMVE